MHNWQRLHTLRLAILSAVAMLLGFISVPLLETEPAQAASTANFNAGNIISDGEFYNGNGLSATATQTFLNQQVPRCTIGDPGRVAGSAWGTTTLASYCLRDFTMTTSTKASNAYCSAYEGRVGESAAQIIFKVGQACGISQKVLLVMLQKEQSLVQDSWPTSRQFDVAMGYGCPDSGPNYSANCDANYFGFQNQVYRAAWQLKVYKALPNSYNYKPFQINAIQWHPNPSCGTSQVYIENSATAALYIYTPYRPNQAALNAGWGAGDGCSSYGNRNFYLYYNTWFVDSLPVGAFDSAVVKDGKLTVRGWALDPDTVDPISVHVYVGDRGFQTVANQPRPDVGAVFPGYGDNHGFSFETVASGWVGNQRVCVFAINSVPGPNKGIWCETVDFG